MSRALAPPHRARPARNRGRGSEADSSEGRYIHRGPGRDGAEVEAPERGVPRGASCRRGWRAGASARRRGPDTVPALRAVVQRDGGGATHPAVPGHQGKPTRLVRGRARRARVRGRGEPGRGVPKDEGVLIDGAATKRFHAKAIRREFLPSVQYYRQTLD